MDAIVDVKPIRPYVLEVAFRDGHTAKVDVKPVLWGKAFEPLLDEARFMEGRFDTDLGSIVWPNGADLSPEFLTQADSG